MACSRMVGLLENLWRSPLGARIAFTIKASPSCPLRATSARLACNTNCELQMHLSFAVLALRSGALRSGSHTPVNCLSTAWPALF